MIDWMPGLLKSLLISLWQSSEFDQKSSAPAKPFAGNEGPVYGSDLYNEVREDERKKKIADDDEDFRRRRNYITDY